MYRRPRTASMGRRVTTRAGFNRFWQVTFSLIVVAAIGAAIMPILAARYAHAAGVTLQPAFLNGSPGNLQVNLNWGAVASATSYRIEQTNLETGKVKQLRARVIGTSFSPTGLAAGQWYRFRVTPVTSVGLGTPSAPIEIRTMGFQGTYAHYYALGDSYTAGDGAPPYSGIKACTQSKNSYPFQLGFGAPTPVLLACSGAVTNNIDRTIQNTSLPATQLNQLKNDPTANSLITMTIGGNDVGFANELKNCITSFHSCTSRKAIIAQKINALEPRLVQVYKEIRQVAPGADILILGYPLLLAAPPNESCHNPAVRIGLSKAEITMICTLAATMDNVITQAAGQAGVTPATKQVEMAFAGHEACAANQNLEWINEIAGLNDMLKDSFHPKAAGYLADALAVNAARAQLYLTGAVRH